MEVSIVTPVYNEPRIQRSLDSILGQEEAPPVEVVVVDGESTDRTTDVIDAYSDDIDVLVREPDDGVYDAMNTGIERSSGDIVGILNADDRYQDPFVLRDVCEQLHESGADLCYGDLVYVDDDDEVVRYWQSGQYRKRRFQFGWMPPHPTVFVRRETYEEYGTFDQSYPIAADYELLLRVLYKHEVTPTYLDRVVVRMATGGQSNASVRNVLQANYEVFRSWRDNGLRGGPVATVLKPLRKIAQFARRPPNARPTTDTST